MVLKITSMERKNGKTGWTFFRGATIINGPTATFPL